MLITTTHTIPGYNIKNMLGVVSANQVLGNNLISENIAAFTDIFGGKSGQYRGKLDELIADVTEQLQTKARARNANAIVGFSVTTNQVSSKGMSMFMITATGTAVQIEADRYDSLKKLHELKKFHREGLLTDEELKYEEARIKRMMNNSIAKDTQEAIERERIERVAEEERQRMLAEHQRMHAEEIKRQEEERRKYEEEHADEILKLTEIKKTIEDNFKHKKFDVETIDVNYVQKATYEGKLPEIEGLSHYDAMRYLVAIGEAPAACKYYCDTYNLSAQEGKDYLLEIYKL